MKAQILKIAGVKNDAEFYKKYPTEEAFMKKHGAKLQKAFAGFDSSSVTGSTGAFSSANMKMAGSDLLQGAGSIMGTISSIAEKKKLRDEMERGVQLSNLVSQAAAGRDKIKRRYVRPEDTIIQPGQLGKPYGEGTNYLAAENGAEIANTFAPNTIYTDLGYEPLHDTNVKQFQGGGSMPGIDPTFGLAGSLGGGLGSLIGGGDFEGSEESQLGSTIGGAIGTAILPGVGTAIGAGLGGLAGGYFGGQHKADILKKKNAMQSNLLNAAFQNNDQFDDYGKNGTTVPSYEEGGWVSNDWMPQVITTFGEHKMSHLLQPPHDADMLRAGGHLKEYTPPSAEAMYTGRDLPYQMEHGGQMAMGGDLQVHRGEAETLSYNPFLPDGGETVMFRGPSHDNGGMPISFGNNGVEVEGGEPAVKLQDGGSPDGNLVVFGNMVIPEYGVAELGDKNAKGKKFKHYVDDLSKIEAKQGKLIEKTTTLINDADVNDQFDKLSLNTGQANLIGTTMKLKDIAEKKKTAAAVQNAILDTASEMGLESDALAKGKIKHAKANDPYAKFGAKMETAQDGKSIAAFIKQLPFAERKQIAKANGIKDFTGTADQNKKLMGILNQVASDPGALQPVTLAPIAEALPGSYIPGMNSKPQQAAQQFAEGPFIPGISKLPAEARQRFDIRNFLPQGSVAPRLDPIEVPYLATSSQWDPESGNYQLANVDVNAKKIKPEQAAASVTPSSTTTGEAKEKSQFPWDQIMTGVNSILPFVRPSNQIPLDPSQLSGELYSLANNQEEPVFAQSYQPLLTQTSNISLQDQLNEITSQSRAAERMAQGNPAALAMIASQAAQAKNKVLGEQFRLNQGEAQRVSETNRQTMNEAQKMNLGLYDQQQQRAAQAKSNTKMQNIAALNSINDKIAKNKLENRQMAISENLYNYRFTPNGVAYNMNPLAQFNTLILGARANVEPSLRSGSAKEYSLPSSNSLLTVFLPGA